MSILFRCSGLGYLMPEPRSKSETISETTKTHLVDLFVSEHYGRREEIYGKALSKGNDREEDSLTLFSRVTKTMFRKNKEHLENSFIKGTPDTYLGETIGTAMVITEIKTSWSANTFFRSKMKDLDKNYYWQVQGYMALTGAKRAQVAFCLVNGTFMAIMDEKRKAQWSYPNLDINNPCQEFVDECKQIEKNHIFNITEFHQENPGFDYDNDIDEWMSNKDFYDIPMKERVHIFEVERNETDIERLYKRINDCRDWMAENLYKEIPDDGIDQVAEDDAERRRMINGSPIQ
jgi:hypothetical protein